METVTLESSTEFGFGKDRHHREKDHNLAIAKQHLTDHIAVSHS